jgi:hypothetical protein
MSDEAAAIDADARDFFGEDVMGRSKERGNRHKHRCPRFATIMSDSEDDEDYVPPANAAVDSESSSSDEEPDSKRPKLTSNSPAPNPDEEKK